MRILQVEARIHVAASLAMFVLFMVGSGYAQKQYDTPFEADEEFLASLVDQQLNLWVSRQLENIKAKYPDRTDDIQFLEAKYAGGRNKVKEAMQKIPTSSSRYVDAQFVIARYSDAKEKATILEGLIGRVDADANPEFAETIRKHLITAYIDIGEIDKAIKILEKMGKGNKRFIEYMRAKLKLMIVDRNMEKADSLSAADRARVEQVIKEIKEGEILWKRDYWGMVGFCEYAHAYLLLGKPKEAFKQLSNTWSGIESMHNEFTGEAVVNSPRLPGIYYLAQIYTQLAKKEAEKEKKVDYLSRAFNIYENELQRKYVRDTQYGKNALRKAKEVRKLLIENGITPPEPGAAEKRERAYEEGLELYRQKKYKEAIPQFLLAFKDRAGRMKSENAEEGGLYLVASYYKDMQFKEAKEASLEYVKNFPTSQNAWNALYNTAIKAYKASREAKDSAKAKEFRIISDELFLHLAKENPNHPKASLAAWMVAERYWQNAREKTKEKQKLAKQVEDARTADQRNELTKNLNDIILEVHESYEKAIPAYQLLNTNYSTSQYGQKATYKLAWIYYIIKDNDEKTKDEYTDKALEYFNKYIEGEEEMTANVIDAKGIVADMLFRKDQFADAIKKFEEVIDLIKSKKYATSDNPKIKAHEEKRLAATLLRATALIPWCYDRNGEIFIEQAQELYEDVEQYEALLKQYEAVLEAKDDNAESVEVPMPPITVPKGEPKTEFEKGKLPEDFGLAKFLTTVGLKANLAKDLDPTTDIRIADNRLWLVNGADAAVTLPGKQAEITLASSNAYWSTNDMACYRDGKLIGVYRLLQKQMDEKDNKVEVPQEVNVPDINENMAVLEAEIRTRRMREILAEKRKKANAMRQKGLDLQEKALSGLKSFIEDPANKRDRTYAPTNFLRIAMIYINREEWKAAQGALNELRERYPNSSEAEKAPVWLFRAFMKAGQIELAMQEAKSLIQDIQQVSVTNLNYLAFGLIEQDEKLTWTSPTDEAPEVALKALDEVLRRGKDPNAIKHDKLKRMREKALYYKAVAYMLKGDYDSAIGQADKLLAENDKTAYLFDLNLLKGITFRMKKQYDKSLDAINEVLRKADRVKYKEPYWYAIILSGKTLLEQNTKVAANKAVLRFEQVVEHIPKDDEDLVPHRELGMYLYAYTLALLGNQDKFNRVRSDYLRSYPDGVWRKEISTPPAKKY